MIEKVLIITNNPMTSENCKDKFDLEFIEGSVLDVFRAVRDYIHRGHTLVTHPLMSSIKPNEIPYRTVIITKSGNNNTDGDSLMLIENSIHTTEKFLKDFNIPNWNEKILKDFQVIDYDIISHGLHR